MNKTVQSLIWCVASALLLGIAQPLLMPEFFGTASWPEYLGILSLIGYVPLFLVIHNAPISRVFNCTFFAVTAQYTVVLFWIYNALHIFGHIAPVPASLITLLLPMILAFMAASFFSCARFLGSYFNKSFLWFAPFALCGAEYFRNYYFFGGFPWGHAGYSVARIPEFLQLASLVGIYGLVFFVGLINAILTALVLNSGGARKKLIGSVCSILLVTYAFGYMRLKKSEHEYAPSIRVALLQGNIPQEIKSSARLYYDDILKIYEGLEEQAQKEQAQLIVWPESSYPRLVNQKSLDLDVAQVGAVTVIGAVTYGDDNGSYYQNSAFILDDQGKILSRYDKSHLVPFGEYVPWPMTSIVDKVVPGMGAFKPGSSFEPTKIVLDNGRPVKVGTTICYEGIFPEIGRAYAKNGADILVNLTNDAWYGVSSAPWQHLLMYQVRSVESGRAYVRATNSGVSAWVDAYGRLKDSLGLFDRGIVVANVPLLTKNTVYLWIGDSVAIVSIVVLLLGFLWATLPLRNLWRERKWAKLLVIGFFLAIALVAHGYFSSDQFLVVEAARTKSLAIMVLCFIFMVGSVSTTKRSKAVLTTIAVSIVIISVLLSIFESLFFLAGLGVAALMYLMAIRCTLDEKHSH